MHSHLVAVEVGVEGRTRERVQLDGAALDQHRFECLDAQAVQRRRTVQEHRVSLDDLFQDIPNLRANLFHHALGALDVVRIPLVRQLFHDKRLEQLKCHFLRQATLIHLELRPDDDNAAAGIVHALAEQVLTEAPLLTA